MARPSRPAQEQAPRRAAPERAEMLEVRRVGRTRAALAER